MRFSPEGLATRLYPVTTSIPKALVDVAGRPFAEHQLDWLRSQRVERVVFCVTLPAVGAKLAGLVKGRFRGIEVLERGRSPRIVAADVVGSAGRTRVDGATLRARLGLLDTWAYFTTINIREAPPVATASGPAARATVAGQRRPGTGGRAVQIQLREGSRWTTVASTIVRRGGTYRAGVAQAGTYRAVFAGEAGPGIRIR